MLHARDIRHKLGRRPLLVFAAATMTLSALILIQLYPTFHAYFMADDFSWLSFTKNHVRWLEVVWDPSPGGWTTPVSNLVFWGAFQIFALDPRGYYAVNAFLHLANALFVYQVVYLVGRRLDVAFAAVLIFALHFANFSDWGPLVWIGAFVQLVVGLFYLGSVVFFVHYTRSPSKWAYLGSLLSFCGALASKETAVSLPLVLLAWCWLAIPRSQHKWRRVFAQLGPFFVVWGAYLAYELVFQSSGRYVSGHLYGVGPHLLTNWQFFSNLVMPNPASPPVQSFLARTFPWWVMGVAFVAVWVVRFGLATAGVLLLWRGAKETRFWVAWMAITYLPFIGFVEGFAGPNRYFYLPAVGFAALLAEGLRWMHGRLSARWGSSPALVVLTIVSIGLWCYNLAPTRAWQKQMEMNSQVRLAVLRLVDDHLDANRTPITQVILTGFPEKFKDLPVALHVLRAVDSVWAVSPDDSPIAPSVLALCYDIGQVVTCSSSVPGVAPEK